MYRHDYVMRLIEAFGKALIAIRNRILERGADSQTVLAELGEMSRKAGVDLDIARRLDTASLLMWLSPTGEYDPARVWLLAELLYLAGLQADADRPGAGPVQPRFVGLAREHVVEIEFSQPIDNADSRRSDRRCAGGHTRRTVRHGRRVPRYDRSRSRS
jgi:hypothetical protein